MSRETYERREEILCVLDIRRHDTIVNLACEFGVNERTIRRDMESLCLSYPILISPGRNGGVQVMEGYSLKKPYLTDEQSALLEKISLDLVGEDLKTMNGILKEFKRPDPNRKRYL